MSVEQLESKIRELSLEERRQFADWFDDHRAELIDENDFELSEEQKAEILRRKKEFLTNPSIAEPWEGTAEKIHQHLHARRAKKTASSRR